MMRPLLSFVAIFKDEAPTVRKTLESVRPFVDRWTILDTGSTDGTQEIVREVMHGLPGSLFQEPFVDYATSRNRALELDAGCGEAGEEASEFTLMLSADETLAGGEALRSFLRNVQGEGAFCVTLQTGPRSWPYTRVLRTGAGWRYVGEIHERPVGPQGEVKGTIIPNVFVTHNPSDPERKARRLKELDVPLLEKAVFDESRPLEHRAHAIFFLAETYAVLASERERLAQQDLIEKGLNGKPALGDVWLSLKMNAMALYLRYAAIAEQPERDAYDPHKVAYALFMAYHIADSARFYNSHELVSRLQTLVAFAPKMPEARFLLAKCAADDDVRQGLFLAIEASKIAREAKSSPTYEATDVRLEWLSLTLAAQCAKQLKKLDQAKELASQGLAAGGPKEAFEGIL